MKKKIYVGCALVNVPEEFGAEVAVLKNTLRLDGYDVLEFAGSNGTVEGAARSDAQSVKDCDLHLAIVTYPSTGLGYELGVAQYCEKPVIAAAERGKRISRVVQGLGALNPQYYYVEYGSLKEIPKLVKDFFEKSPKRVRRQLLS